jgi:hypothetical protein
VISLPHNAALERHPAPLRVLPTRVSTWLPQPDHWPTMTVQAQHDTSGTMLSLYRTPCAFDERCRTYMTHPSPGAGRLPTC